MALGAFRLALRPMATTLTTQSRKLFSPRCLLYTNTAITVSLSVFGDLSQQAYQATTGRKGKEWDKKRTIHIAGSGLVIGPFVHFWYLFLDRFLPGRTLSVLCKKVLVDQLVCSPVYLSLFMLSMGAMEKKNWSEIGQAFVDKGSVLYAAEWIVWPPAQFFNFYFLPTRFRVLYDNSVSLIFDVFWSYVWYEMDDEEADMNRTIEKLSACNDSCSEEKY